MEHDDQLPAVFDAAHVHQHQSEDERGRVPLGSFARQSYNAFVGGNPFPYKGTFITGGGLLPRIRTSSGPIPTS